MRWALVAGVLLLTWGAACRDEATVPVRCGDLRPEREARIATDGIEIGSLQLLAFGANDPRGLDRAHGLDILVTARADGSGFGAKVGFGPETPTSLLIDGASRASGARLTIDRSLKLSQTVGGADDRHFYPGFIWAPELGIYRITVEDAEGNRWTTSLALCETLPGVVF